MSESVPTRRRLLPPQLVKPLAIAFGIGLLLFFLVWLDQRNDTDFFKAGDPATGAPGEFASLPAPVPADVAGTDGSTGRLGMPAPDPRAAAERPRIVDAPQAPPPPAAPAPAAAPAVADSATPVPLSQPAPRYPRTALNRGIGGTVQVRATIAADGSVERMELATGSGNRDLDRAAMEAVRRWTFKPATRNGQPIVTDVLVPITFNPQP